MREKFSIRLISINEIPEVTNWARLEGFSPGMDDLSIYRNTDKQGVWVACLDDNPIGSIACIKYNSSYCLLYTSPSPRDTLLSRMPSSA